MPGTVKGGGKRGLLGSCAAVTQVAVASKLLGAGGSRREHEFQPTQRGSGATFGELASAAYQCVVQKQPTHCESSEFPEQMLHT